MKNLKKLKHLHATFPWKGFLRTFFVMLFSAAVFGLSSYNLFYLLKANLNFFFENGWMAIADGALRQLFMLVSYGSVSLIAYIIFKCGEKTIVDIVTQYQKTLSARDK
jgi:hypothetical protein